MKKIVLAVSVISLFIAISIIAKAPALGAVKQTAHVAKTIKTETKQTDLVIESVKLSSPTVEGPITNQVMLYGYVRNIETGKPFPGAFVGIIYSGFKPGMEITGISNAITDSDGRYEFRVNPDFYPYMSGQYTISVSGPNSLGLTLSNYSVFVRDDEQMKIDVTKTQRLDINLYNRSTYSKPMPDAIIYGKVLDKDTGRPLPNAEIAIYFKGHMGSFIANTNQNGFYQISATNGGFDGGYTLNRFLSGAPEFGSRTNPSVDFFDVTVFGPNKTVIGTLMQYPEQSMAGKREINFQVPINK